MDFPHSFCFVACHSSHAGCKNEINKIFEADLLEIALKSEVCIVWMGGFIFGCFKETGCRHVWLMHVVTMSVYKDS